MGDVVQQYKGLNKGETPFAKGQRMIQELPVAMQGMNKHLASLSHTLKEQVSETKKQTELSERDLVWAEQFHSRIESLYIEARTTNLLLAELVALQQVMVKENVDYEREAIRVDAYQRVLNGD